MKYSSRVKPISYDMANAASYEQTQETLALLKVLALGNRQIEAGRVVPAAEAMRRARESEAALIPWHDLRGTPPRRARRPLVRGQIKASPVP